MRAGLFVDGANLYGIQRNILGWKVDPKKMRDFWRSEYTLVESIYYHARSSDSSDASYLRALVHMGFSVTAKDIKKVNADTFKGNLDVEMALDIVLQEPHYDIAIIVTGDGDFLPVLKALRARGKRFKILSTEASVAWELREYAGQNFIDFKEVEEKVRDYDRRLSPLQTNRQGE